MLYDLAQALALRISSTVVLDRVVVTPSEPPASDDCTAAYVWADSIFDSPIGVQSRGEEAGCIYRRAYVINYRIDHCFTPVQDDGSEPTEAVFEAAAEVFYDQLDLIWCAIAEGAYDGSLFDTSCEDVVVGALIIQPSQGDRVQAEGNVRVTMPCSVFGS